MTTSSLITSSNWLARASKKLSLENITSARLDSLLIMESVLKLPRLKLISQPNIRLKPDELTQLNKLLSRRLKGEPMAYILGKIEFYGRQYLVDKNVMVPRPESEAFIELTKALKLKQGKVGDIGCGSGCLGISIKLEMPSLSVELFDNSSAALAVADKNAEALKADVVCIKVDLLKKLDGQYKLLVVNLPYVPDKMSRSGNLKYEPAEALFAGVDGMNTYRDFWKEIKLLKRKPTHILCESLTSQHSEMKSLACPSGYKPVATDGLVQLFSSA